MVEKSELGKRIKRIREEKHLTLKNIEAAAGISATHISEIERGKTSPTLGALIRISKALGKDPSYFIEEEELGEVCLVTLENRIRESIRNGAGTIERLTSSIPGGRLQACVITLGRGKSHQHDSTQTLSVHALPSSQSSAGPPVQTPPEQVSVVVQPSPSSHGFSFQVFVQPRFLSHESSVQTLSSSQSAAGPPSHSPPTHVSAVVQASPSSHAAVLLA